MWELFRTFFQIGLFTFGGGYAMIAQIKEVVVEKKQWLTDNELVEVIAIAESTPGPIAVNTATFIGSVQGGFFGSVCATLGVVLPSFLIILLIAAVLKKCTQNPYFKSFMKGVRPIIAALILSTGLTLLWSTLGISITGEIAADWISVVIFALLTAVYCIAEKCFHKKLSSITLILISAALGVLTAYPFG